MALGQDTESARMEIAGDFVANSRPNVYAMLYLTSHTELGPASLPGGDSPPPEGPGGPPRVVTLSL
jgi:hypothetical protein